MFVEYHFRIGEHNFYIGRTEVKGVPQALGFQERIIGSVWELVTDLKAEKPEKFEHECVDMEWRSLGKLWPKVQEAECPYCLDYKYGTGVEPGTEEWERIERETSLDSHGTAECPQGSHRCILSLPVYICEHSHCFHWLGRFVDLDKQQWVHQVLRKYDWDV